jgi:4-amino-4-deoxy-L-arabinose transferase-like glycosyltransferase
VTSSEKKHLLYLALFSFALRLLVFIATPIIGGDSYNFIVVARAFSEGRFYEGLKEPIHPFFPWIIYLFSLITGEYEVSGKAVSLLFGTLTALPVYFLARSIFTHKVALFAVLLLAINPAHVRHSADIMSESTYIFFFVTSIWLAWEASVQRKGYLFPLTGLSLAAAYLTRAEGIVLLFIIPFWLSLACLRDTRHALLKGLLHISLIVAVFTLGAMPYLIFIHKQKGQWLFTKQLAALQFIGSREAIIEATDSETAIAPIDNLKAVKARAQLKGSKPDSLKLAEWKEKGHYYMIGLYILNTYAKVFYLPLLPFLFFGLFKFISPEVTKQPTKALALLKSLHLRRAAKYPRAEYLLLSLFLIYFIIFFKFAYTNYYLSGRYFLPLVVVGCLWGGAGLQVISEYLSKAFPSFRDTGFGLSRATIALVAVSLVLTLPKDLKVKRSHEIMQKVAGKWIKEHCPEKPPVIMGLEKVAFYADGEFASISRVDLEYYEQLMVSIKSRGVEYLVFYKELIEQTNPNLFREINSDKDFTLLKEWTAREKEGSRHLMLYRNREIVQKVAGKWIREHYPCTESGYKIAGLGNVENVAFYAYWPFVSISESDLECYEKLIENLGKYVEYFVFYEEQIERINPDLLREINSGKDFFLIKMWTVKENEGDRHLKLYRYSCRKDEK